MTLIPTYNYLVPSDVDYTTPTTGFNYTIPNNVLYAVINPATELATGTIVMPASPSNNQTVSITTSQTITSVVHTANAGQTLNGSLLTMVSNTAYSWIYLQPYATWFVTSGIAANGGLVVPLTSAITSSTTAIGTSTTYLTAQCIIPANVLNPGASFRITLEGTCTSSHADTSTLSVRFGTTGTISDGIPVTMSVTSAGSGGGIPFWVEAIITIRSNGSSGTAVGSMKLINNGTTGISTTVAAVAGAGGTSSVNTTAVNYIGISYGTSANTTQSTFYTAIVEQIE